MQTELQSEFNELITEISKEVLELSVSKSIKDSSNLIKNQVPAMTRNIEELRLVLRNLNEVNNEHRKHQEAVMDMDQRINFQLDSISKKIDSKTNTIQSNITDSQEKTAITLRVGMKSVEDITKREAANLDNQFTRLIDLTKEGVQTGTTTKKLLIWTFIFSMGSFGIMITFLLHTLKIISF